MADQLDYAGERDADVPVDDLVEGDWYLYESVGEVHRIGGVFG